MMYSHTTNHSYVLEIEFWCSIETVFNSIPSLIEGNTTLFALGLVATMIPYLFYLLKGKKEVMKNQR